MLKEFVGASLMVTSLSACTGHTPAPTSPTPTGLAPTAIVGKVTGELYGEVPPNRFGVPQSRAVANATVTVIGGTASGTVTMTGDNGSYEVTAGGRFKLRFEHSLFVTSESNEIEMGSSGVTVPAVRLTTAPWTVSGRATDGQENPVADADVYLNFEGSLLVVPDLATRTDAAGRYTFASARPHFETVTITVLKPIFETASLPMKCCGQLPDIRLRHR